MGDVSVSGECWVGIRYLSTLCVYQKGLKYEAPYYNTITAILCLIMPLTNTHTGYLYVYARDFAGIGVA